MIANSPIETLLEENDFKIYDQQFIDDEENTGFHKFKIYEKFLPLHLEENYFEANDDKITFKKALSCSKECAYLFLHIISILEYSFCVKKIRELSLRLKKLKYFIRKHEYRIDFLKTNFNKIAVEQLRLQDTLEVDDKFTLFDFNTNYKDHFLILHL